MKNKTRKPVSTEENSKRSSEEKTSGGNDDSGNNRSQKESNKDFPGYPHYPATEDIFNNREEKLPLVEEEVTQPEKNNPQLLPEDKILNEKPVEKSLLEEDEESKPASEADVTPEEIMLLDSDNLNADGGDDDQLRNRVTPVDMSGADLDVPGSELDDADEAVGEEDEENNPFSIGGDRHEGLEETPL
ncbi:MAG TPA: hypothetical protein VE978_18520 [Chitinophagales bacterium]|nr:hypothetical protein [Chitinophagales bacterium]